MNKSEKKAYNNGNKFEKYKLTEEEIKRVNEIDETIKKNLESGEIDARLSFERFYLGFLQYVKDRKIVKNDLDQLKTSMMETADKMIAIIRKSREKIPGPS